MGDPLEPQQDEMPQPREEEIKVVDDRRHIKPDVNILIFRPTE